jgi:hypothetical protein
MARLTNDDDGLPDLLLPPAALAWQLGRPELARRWLTAVRQAGRPTSTFMLTIMFRKLRAEVGPLGTEPLHDDLDAVFDEAVQWMETL